MTEKQKATLEKRIEELCAKGGITWLKHTSRIHKGQDCWYVEASSLNANGDHWYYKVREINGKRFCSCNPYKAQTACKHIQELATYLKKQSKEAYWNYEFQMGYYSIPGLY